MPNNNRFGTDVGSFMDRLRGKERVTTGDKGINILPAPETEREKQVKQKVFYISQYIRNKTYTRRHVEFFDEYRRMATTFPIIKAGLDIYAEEATAKNQKGDIITIKSSNKKVKKMLEDCFFKNLKINTRGKLIIREFCKFGNTYAYITARPKSGVTGLVFLPPDALIREQLFNPDNLQEYRFIWYGGGGAATFEPWEIVHWKNIEDIETEPYGSSILRPIVDTWRRVVLIREALVIYRITRAPSKLLFKIASDGMTGEEAYKFAQEMKKEVNKKPLVNPETGEIDFKYNPLSIEENIYVPITQDSASDVTVLEGASNLDAVEDYKIIKDDLFAGLKIPKSFLSFEEDLSNKASLGEEDIRFAKTIQGIQSEFIEGLLQIGLVHLFLCGCSQEEMQDFTIEMANPSAGSEKRKWEIMQAKVDVASKLWDSNQNGLNFMSYVDVLKTVFKFTDEEIQQTIKSQFSEKKLAWRLQQLRENGFYEEPEIDKLMTNMNDLTGGMAPEKINVFNSLGFEGKTFSEILKKKVDKELLEMIGPPVEMQPETKQIVLVEGSLKKNLNLIRREMNW